MNLKKIYWLFIIALSSLQFVYAEGIKLQSIDFSTLPGDNLQLQLTLSGPASAPRIFHTDNPARIALDLPGVSNALDKKQIPVNVGGAESIMALEASGRTRVIINLAEMSAYSSRIEDNHIFIVLHQPASQAVQTSSPSTGAARRIENIDFRRGEKGEGRIIIDLSDPKIIADIHEEGRKIIAGFPNTSLPERLSRKLDVQDFATPVRQIESTSDGNRTRMLITPLNEDYDYSSYQLNNQLTIELRPLAKAEKEELQKKNQTYSGEKLSLNFQDIPVRSVLQILADFTHINIIASDTVQGSVTLRLADVPWDQALDLILKSKGLGKRQEGNIIRVSPMEEINRQEKEELEAQKIVDDLEPLKTEIIQINYTKAEDIKSVIAGTTEKNTQTETNQENNPQTMSPSKSSTSSTSIIDISQSILSPRGNVTVDARTNQLIVKDTARNIERIRDLIKQLDIPIRQVLIESRIVIASHTFARSLGSRLSARGPVNNLASPTAQNIVGATGTAGDMLTSLAASQPTAVAGITLLKAGDYLLDLELSAAQSDNQAEVVSNPKLITADQNKAIIKQGVELPYVTNSISGGLVTSTVSFKQANLELNVTPHITPDEQILMELLIKKDEKGDTVNLPNQGTAFAINRREIQTTSQVSNGETVVLGGVYEGSKTNNTGKVPFFGDLPGIGFMFRQNSVEDKKTELLIFITPKIMKPTMGVH